MVIHFPFLKICSVHFINCVMTKKYSAKYKIIKLYNLSSCALLHIDIFPTIVTFQNVEHSEWFVAFCREILNEIDSPAVEQISVPVKVASSWFFGAILLVASCKRL